METLLDGGAFFESPRWHDGRWWVSDFFRHVVLTVGQHGRAEEIMRVDAQPSGLGWLPDGSLLVVSMRDRRVLRRATNGDVTVHADLSEHCDWHANDVVVAADGRTYVGNFGFDLGNESPRATVLVRVDLDGSVSRVADGLLFPNGSVITPDARTLIVAETWAARLTAFTIAGDGSLHGREVWAAVPRTAPDGCTLDAEGCVWFADARHDRCVRVARGGAILDERTLPEGLRCFACMLGGEDGRTLAICAAPDYDERKRIASRDSVLLTARVDVPHAGLP
ncbi:MAG: SMP-30/gluconolactonase/LRE family protein [Gaiellaceae bacterium]